MNKAEGKCEYIAKLLETLPILHSPSDVPFLNGLYFFYEKGEVSNHAPKGRIVRIGNHPRSQDGLKKRLQMHYSGNKNSSVFRKFLGGAIMRKQNPNNPCLLPRQGEGHWEKQNLHTCKKCKPIEKEVKALLRNNFWFRCLEIKDRSLRNSLEKQLVATISLCPLCKPSRSWLGNFAYSENIRESGLWNSDFVFEKGYLINDHDLKTLSKLVAATMSNFNTGIVFEGTRPC